MNVENNATNLEDLKSKLKENLTMKSYKRVKVSVSGKVQDNCNIRGVATCCFGKTMTIKAQEVIQLAPVEDYTRPE